MSRTMRSALALALATSTAYAQDADLEKAVQGATQAEALLANPYANGVRIMLGEHNEERGLAMVRQEVSRVATVGCRQCRATNRSASKNLLFLNVADEYLHDVDVPVRVTIEYYDLAKGRFRFWYDSTDMGALDHGAQKWSPWITRTNSKTWKTVTLDLPDAKFANRGRFGTDMALSSQAWDWKEDIYISSVRVTRGGLSVGVEPGIAVADGESICTLTAKVVEAVDPAPNGAIVRFAADRGTVSPDVKTVDGEAKAVFRPGTEPGEATITVQTRQDRRVVHVPILAGRGPATRCRFVLDSFKQHRGWRFQRGRGTAATMQPAPEEPRDQRPSTRINFRLRARDSESQVSFRRPMALPGRPATLGLWVKADGSRNRVQVMLVDATGQTLGFRLGDMPFKGWRYMEQDLGDPIYFQGGAADGRLHLPARFEGLQIARYYSGPGKANGEIWVQDLTLITDVPQSATETVLIEAGLAKPDMNFGPVYYQPQPAAFRVDLTCLGNETKLGRLHWRITGEQGKAFVQGKSGELRIDPGSRISVPVAAALSAPGTYHAQFTLATCDEAKPPSAELRFLALRHLPHSSLAVQIRRRDEGIAIRLDNRTDKAMQFALSYRLLSVQYELLRKGMAGEPQTKLRPGEVLDVPVSLEGFPVGRYRALVFLDTAGGDHFTRLLPFDVYPDVATVPVKVVSEDQSPIRNASLRARLSQRLHPRLDDRERTLQEWEVQTDAKGLCELQGLRVPGAPTLCRVHLDVVAEGFADLQHPVRLNRFVDPGARPTPAQTVRLSRGVPLAGRVVGDDGQPVSDARVTAMGMVRKGSRIARIHWYRPRTTDADGRFELTVHAGTETELTAYAAHWMPKRVSVPAGKRDAGDIELEHGAVITGALVDEKGKPAPGYWVVVESLDRGPSSMVAGLLVVAAQTEPDGTFVLPPLKGKWLLSTPASFQAWPTEAHRHSPQPRVVVRPQTLTLGRDDVALELRAVPSIRIGGRVLDLDGKTARDVNVRLSYTTPSSQVLGDRTLTDDSGRFAFEGIPSGVSGIMVAAPTLRTWKRGRRIYLRARPITYAHWQRRQLAVVLERIDSDVLDLDFQICFWNRKDGFMEVGPDGQPVPARKRGLMPGISTALQGLAKSLAQTTSFTGRVLDEKGKGLRGAQIRFMLVNVRQDGKKQPIGSRDATTAADGTYVLATAPIPQPAEQCRIRVEVVAEGYAKLQKEFPLCELVKPGAQALRMPDLRLETEGER